MICCVGSAVLPVRDLGRVVLLSRNCGEMLPRLLGGGTLKLLHVIAMNVPIAQWA